MAHLAQALRLNPQNREASDLTVAMLTQLGWHAPLRGSMLHDAAVKSAQFSIDGQRVVTASGDTAQLWDVASGKPIGKPIKHPRIKFSAIKSRLSADGDRFMEYVESR